MDIQYRLANHNDLDNICALIRRAIDTMALQNIFQWDDLYPAREDFEADIAQEQLYVGMTKENNLAVIYTLNCECEDAYKQAHWQHDDQPYRVLHRLCVDPDFQHQGIAHHTLLHIEADLKDQGIHAIRLDVFSANPFSLKLYDHLGYTRTGFADWRKGRFYLMEKYF